MAIVNISLIQSDIQIIPGIPKFIKFETDIPANIFYTLDGSDPSMESSIYLEEVILPIQYNVTLKYFGTDGVDNTEIFEINWEADKAQGHKMYANFPDAPITNKPDKYNLYPYGGLTPPSFGAFEDIVLEPVNAPNVENISNGFDGQGNETGFTDKPLTEYQLIFPPGNGERPNKIGSLVGKTTIINDNTNITQFTTTTVNKLFNPRAMVMYQDGTDPNIDPQISSFNKQFFYSSNLQSMDGVSALLTNAANGSAPGGSFLNYYFNKKEQTLTFYYYDNLSCRWIISKEPYKESQIKPENLSSVVFIPGQPSSRFVYRWIPFVTNRIG